MLIFLSGERTAFFLLILGTMMIIFLVPNFRLIRAITFLFSCLAVILITTQFTFVKERMIDQTIGDMGIANPNQDTVIFSQGHQDHYITAFRMFLDKPLIGHGPKMFRLVCNNKKYFSCMNGTLGSSKRIGVGNFRRNVFISHTT